MQLAADAGLTHAEPELDAITRVTAERVVLPLRQPLELGSLRIAERGYVVVTVETASGLVGHSVALCRDTPVREAISGPLARALVGQDAGLITQAWERMFHGSIAGGRVGTIMRGLSLVDIALWDIKGQRAGLPVWRLLGGARTDVPVQLVVGYPRSGWSPEQVGERVAASSHEGWPLLKIARSLVHGDTTRTLRAAAARLRDGSRLVLDAAWAYDTPERAVQEMADWQEAPLAWLEDPLRPENLVACRRLAALSSLPIAYGDEVTDEHTLLALVRAEALRVLRVDATTIGGFTGAMRVVHAATAAGIPVSFHVYPELHVHLGLGLAGELSIESFDPADNPFDRCSDLLDGGPPIAAGRARAWNATGLGFALDHERIRRHRVP